MTGMRLGIGKANLVFAGLLLAGAVGLQFLYRPQEVPEAKTRARMQWLVPRHAGEWRGGDEPLGATETINAAALKTLNLDDYVYRRFSKGGRSFTIYAAYWGRGRVPTRLVASHTPDRCWTENGMKCVDMRFRQRYSLGGHALLPAEYRAFTSPDENEKTFVAYWHTVDGNIYDYGTRFNAIPHPLLWWKDTFAQAARGSREQLFVRIASTTPLEELWSDAGFQSVITKVADLGLWGTTR